MVQFREMLRQKCDNNSDTTTTNNNNNNNSRFDKIEFFFSSLHFFHPFSFKKFHFSLQKREKISRKNLIIDRFFFAPHHLPTRINTHRRRRRRRRKERNGTERNPNCSSSSSCSRRRRCRWRLSLRGAKMFCREEGDRRLKKRGEFLNSKRNRNRTSSLS